MRKNSTALIVLIAGIFLFLLLVVGSLGYAVFVNGSKAAVTESVETGKTTDKKEVNETSDTVKETEKAEKKEEKPKQSKVTLADLKEKPLKDEEYSNDLNTRTKHESKDCYYYTDDMERLQKCGTMWDDELNEVYQILMKKLTPSQQEELKSEQRKWIKQRDAALNKATGTATDHAYQFFDLTLTRTYELANLYDRIK